MIIHATTYAFLGETRPHWHRFDVCDGSICVWDGHAQRWTHAHHVPEETQEALRFAEQRFTYLESRGTVFKSDHSRQLTWHFSSPP